MSRGLNLREFISKYAPPSDNNPTENYIAYVAGKLGVSDSTPLSQLAQIDSTQADSSPFALLPDLAPADSGSSSSIESMWPWLAVGAGAVALGVLLFRLGERRDSALS